jgi:CDP-glucose 4,6-dehydratase
MENLVIKKFQNIFKNKRILIIGNTGFVGSWLSISLNLFQAKILGLSLKMKNNNYLSNSKEFQKKIKTIYADINDFNHFKNKIKKFNPEIVIHLASQPIVKTGYINPLETFETNIFGTIRILELLKKMPSVKQVLVFTSDKVYANKEKKIYTEEANLGGLDPYSASKSCQDIISQSYAKSFFKSKKMIILRSGNIIGGGDWSENRIIPDIVKSYINKKILKIRSINSTRPWIHVLDVIHAILLTLGKKSNHKKRDDLIFNLSPSASRQVSVKKIIELIKKNTVIKNISLKIVNRKFSEKKYLNISSKRALLKLNWKTKLSLERSLKLTINFYLTKKKILINTAENQIKEYFSNKQK